MALYMIGIGLSDEKDITVKGLEAVKRCSKVFLEGYTSILQVPKENLEEFYGKEVIVADREMVEKRSDEILDAGEDVAFLVIGDVFSATTHTDLRNRAFEKDMDVFVINNTSVMTAVGVTGLELYKFGKTTSIPFPEKGFEPETPYDVVKMNKSNGLHTLLLLDLRPTEGKFMTVNDALTYLLVVEEKRGEGVFTKDSVCLGVARLGSENVVKYGKASDLIKEDFGTAPHCLIVPGKLHFVEEEALEKFRD